jgi:uncharacterized protein YqjF (DUF2071 family)
MRPHSFAVEAHFESSLVLTYAVPKEDLQDKIPPCLTLDTFEDKWAFVAVAIVKTHHLRPKGLPKFLGNSFQLIGYRIFVRYTTSEGKKLRGLYILKSETDKQKMVWLGNIFTRYKYNQTDIHYQQHTSITTIFSEQSNIKILIDNQAVEVLLPSNSPFPSWKEARRFAGPLPFTFSYEADTHKVLIVEGVRENWTPQPVKILQHEVGFIKLLGLSHTVLANAFLIQDIPYYWKKGRIDTWKP